MYKEEKVINGILHRRFTPDGLWERVDVSELTRRVIEAEEQIRHMKNLLQEMLDKFNY